MQYIDYLIWSDIDCKNGKNILATKLGYLLNALQPVFILLLLFVEDNKYKNLIILVNIIYICIVLRGFFDYIKDNKCSEYKGQMNGQNIQ